LYRYDTPREKALEIATSRMESLVSQIIIAEAP
jgi:hypothetical protein